MKWLWILLLSASIAGATTTDCDGSFADCQAKVIAAGAGDTIRWPVNGTYSYTATFVINKGTNITLDGRGSTIQDDIVSRARMFEWDAVAGVTYRMTNFKIVSHNQTTLGGGAIEVFGYSHAFRIDHVTIQNVYRAPGIKFYNNIWGVVDHCVFDSGTKQGLIIWHDHYPDTDASGGHRYGDGAWAAASDFGTEKFIFVEYNTFIGCGQLGATDAEWGGRVVFRHNTNTNCFNGNHGIEGGARGRAARAYEWYLNRMTSDDGEARAFFLRGGTGLIWGNDVTGFTTFCSMRYFRNEVCAPIWMIANGTSLYDGNVGYPADTSGYPCIDQPGRGQGDALDSTTGVHDVSDCTGTPPVNAPGGPHQPALPQAWPNQALEPILFWDNTFTSVTNTVPNGENASIQNGRDFIVRTSAAPGYTPYTDPHPLDDGEVPTAPSNYALPHLEGLAIEGQVLTCTTGGFVGIPVPTYTYQWRVCDSGLVSCSDISGATSATYTLQAAQINQRVLRRTIATNSQGSANADSNPTGTVSASSPLEKIINGGFETKSGSIDLPTLNEGSWDGWTVVKTYPGVCPTTTSHSGSYAFRVTKGWGDASNIIYIEQTFSVLPSTTYPLLFWSKNDFHPPEYSVYDVTHSAYITDSGGDGRIAAASSGSFALTSTTFTTPAGCTSVRLRFDANDLTGGNESFYLDDVSVVPPPAAPGGGGGGAAISTRSSKKNLMPRKR